MKADICSGWFRIYSEIYSVVVEDGAHNYLMLVVNVEYSKCHLDKEVFVFLNNVLGM